ncbi:MAG: hypothetical protein AB2L09_08440 [Coriobacteriia bacterium]
MVEEASGLTCREFVHRVVSDADAVARRESYPCIAKHFTKELLARYWDDAPYYCHYMLWRLATLHDYQLRRLDTLMECAEAIPGWAQEAPSLLCSREFAEFWSLVWQLQVAEFLVTCGFQVKWNSKGPDLTASRNGSKLFVECLTPRKQYGRLIFLEELLEQIHPQLRVTKQLFLPVSNLDDSIFAARLGLIVKWLTVPGRIESLEIEAQRAYPILVPLPDDWSGIVVCFEGRDTNAYNPGVLPQGGGDPDVYLRAMIEEAVRGKQGSNNLVKYRPNVLAINLLLDDFQIGLSVGRITGLTAGSAIDKLAWGAIGIDDAIQPGSLYLYDIASQSAGRWKP